jgi:hypothetical protein
MHKNQGKLAYSKMNTHESILHTGEQDIPIHLSEIRIQAGTSHDE